MRTLIALVVTLACAASASAQQTFTVTLTAKQVDALQIVFGADADLTAKTQAWVNDWLVQFVRDRDEREKREIKAALETVDAKTAEQVRTLLKVSVPKAVTEEERAARVAALKAEADAKAAEVAKARADKEAAIASAKAEEIKRLLAACQAENATLAAAKGTVVIDCAKFIK